jgi:hypothetical protein
MAPPLMTEIKPPGLASQNKSIAASCIYLPFQRNSLGFLFVDKLPRLSPGTIVPMEFDRHDHFGLAILAVRSVLVCSIQQDRVQQLQGDR